MLEKFYDSPSYTSCLWQQDVSQQLPNTEAIAKPFPEDTLDVTSHSGE